jgi:hypothetical protein
MRTTMRRGIALAALAAGIGVVSLFGAAPASAESCTVPQARGITFTALNETGIGCTHAHERALQLFHHGKTEGYTCPLKVSGRSVSYKCTSNQNSAHTFSVAWYVH